MARNAKPTPGLLPWLALVCVWIFWGSTYLGIRYAVRTIPPLLMAGSRYVLAGILLALILLASGQTLSVSRRQLLSAAIAGALLFLGGNALLSLSEQHLASGFAALIVAVVPLLMIVESAFLSRTRLTRWQVGAIVLGTAGVALLVGAPGGNVDVLWSLILLVGSASWATGSVYAARASMPANPMVSATLQMLIGGILLGAVGLVTGEAGSFHAGHISQQSALGFVWLVLAGSLLAFSAYAYALRALPTSVVATYAYANPVVAVIIGVAVGDQAIHPGFLAGGAAIIVAVALALVPMRARAEPEKEMVTTAEIA